MKKSALLVALLIFAACVFAQVPKAFNYQAVVRNSSGEIIANQDVSFRISILENSESGTAVYVETHTLRTNNFGLANLKIGRGTKISGTFEAENWKENTHFIQVEIDPEGGSNFSLLGTSE